MSELVKIDDYGETTQNLIPSRFSGKPGFNGILSACDNQFDDLEDSTFELLMLMWIDTAAGANLDLVGNIVDILRRGRDDESYRSLIKLKIKINIGSGQPELLIQAVRELYEATEIHYVDNFPAGVIIQQNGSIGLFLITELEIDDGSFMLLDDGEPLTLRSPDTSASELLDLVVPAGVELQIASI